MPELEISLFAQCVEGTPSDALPAFFDTFRLKGLNEAQQYASEIFGRALVPPRTTLLSCTTTRTSVSAFMMGGSSFELETFIDDINGLKPAYFYLEVMLDGNLTKQYGAIAGVSKNYKSVLAKLRDVDINIALRIAVTQVKDKLVKQCLTEGADPNLKVAGRPAVFFSTDYARWSVIKAYILAGANPNSIETMRGQGNGLDRGDPLLRTVITQASDNIGKELAKMLIEHGADLNYQSPRDGWTALHCAAAEASLPKVKLLLENGADKLMKSKDNLTPLDWAKKTKLAIAEKCTDGNDMRRLQSLDKIIKILEA